MDRDRSWMYRRHDSKGVRSEFLDGVDNFIAYALSLPENQNSKEIRCPCVKCQNLKHFSGDVVQEHLYRKGFVKDYYQWRCHGELFVDRGGTESDSIPVVASSRRHVEDAGAFRDMVFDVAGPSMQSDLEGLDEEEPPNPDSQIDLLKASEEPLWEGCSNHTQLSGIARLVSIKSEHNLSDNDVAGDNVARASPPPSASPSPNASTVPPQSTIPATQVAPSTSTSHTLFPEEVVENPQGLPVLEPRGQSFSTQSLAARKISKEIKLIFEGAWHSFKVVPPGVKDMWFQEFKKKHYWMPEHEGEIRSAWNKRAAKRLSDMMTKVRAKGVKPYWIKDHIYAELVAHWQSPEFLARSEAAKRNRSASSCRHTGGSVSATETKEKLTKELGRSPTFKELYERTHQHQDDARKNKYVDEKSAMLMVSTHNRTSDLEGTVTAQQQLLQTQQQLLQQFEHMQQFMQTLGYTASAPPPAPFTSQTQPEQDNNNHDGDGDGDDDDEDGGDDDNDDF